MMFLLFFETPGNEPIEPHLVPSTPFLSILVGASRIFPFDLFICAWHRIVAMIKVMEDWHPLNCEERSHFLLLQDELLDLFLDQQKLFLRWRLLLGACKTAGEVRQLLVNLPSLGFHWRNLDGILLFQNFFAHRDGFALFWGHSGSVWGFFRGNWVSRDLFLLWRLSLLSFHDVNLVWIVDLMVNIHSLRKYNFYLNNINKNSKYQMCFYMF